MEAKMREALADYGRTIKRDGWRAGERLIRERARRFPEFRRWADALGIMLRAQELLDDDQGHVAK